MDPADLVAVEDAEIARAVAAQAPAMEELLVRLVEAPTLLGNEEPGQKVMEDAFRGLGLEPVDVPMDADALRAHPSASPFSWDVSGKRNVVATWPAGGERRRPLAAAERPHRRGPPGAGEPLADLAVPGRRARTTGCTGAAPAT